MVTKRVQRPEAVRDKINRLRDELNTALVERKTEVDGLLVALLAREHILLLGPPGTAKTLLVRLLTTVIAGCSTFTRLLTRFSVPEELFGPYSLKGLKDDKYERVTRGKLPEANLAFLDEVFKANSSILNSLLTLINERVFENGTTTIDCPLETMVGASNEMPESNELDALYDRFMLRYWTAYIADRGSMKTMLMAGDATLSVTLTLEELHTAQAEADAVVVTEDTVDRLLEIKAALEKQGFVASDRRWSKCLRILQAHAYLNKQDEVLEDDLMVLQHILWKEPKDRGALAEIVAKIANPLAHAAMEVLDAAKEVYRGLPIGNDVPSSKNAEVFAAIISATGEFRSMTEKLKQLANGRRSAAVEDAIEQIATMSLEASRFAAKVSGLSLRA